MPRTTPTQAKAAERRAMVSRGPLARLVTNAAVSDLVQGVVDGVTVLSKHAYEACGPAALICGLALADVITTCRNAAELTANSHVPRTLAEQQRVRAALAAPIANWHELEAAFVNTNTMLHMTGKERKRVRVVSEGYGGLGTVIDAIDIRPDHLSRAARIHTVFMGVATKRDLTLAGQAALDARSPKLYSLPITYFSCAVARYLAACAAEEAAALAPAPEDTADAPSQAAAVDVPSITVTDAPPSTATADFL